MSSNGGGGSNLLDMGLMVAAGVAAPEIAPELLDASGGFMGLEGTAANVATGAIAGAGLSGIAGGLTGQNVGRSALVGGIGGAAAGYMAPVGSVDPTSPVAAQVGTPMTPTAPVQTTTAFTPEEIQAGVGTPITSGLPSGSGLSPDMMQAGSGIQGVGPNLSANSVPGSATDFATKSLAQPFDASNKQLITGGISGLMGYQAPVPGAYTPPGAIYKGGNLQYFKYDPRNYQPDVVVPPSPLYHAQYAEGGIAALAQGGKAVGISDLGSYSDGGRLLKGPGDGMSDDIPATIGGKQEARLADGEFVVPADVVSGLGNGSTDAGAKHLYKMMDKVRHARTGRKSQAKQIKGEKYVPA